MNPQKRLSIKKIFHFSTSIFFWRTSLFSLSQCSGSPPEPEKLDPPFICISPCRSSLSINNTSSPETPTTTLVFSGFNREQLFSGYNIRYGLKNDIIQDHASKSNKLVLHSSASRFKNILDANKIGGKGPFPSFKTSQTLSTTSFVTLTIRNTKPNFYLYVSAYNLSDHIESPLSNPLLLQ